MAQSAPQIDRRGGGVRFVLFVVVLALLLGDALVLRDIREGPSADEALHDARHYVMGHPGVSFRGSEVIDVRDAQDKSKTVQTINGRVSGAFDGLAKTRFIADEGAQGAIEVIGLDKTIYVRAASSAGELPNEKFATFDASSRAGNNDSFVRIRALNIESLLKYADNARRIDHDLKTTTVRADVEPARLLGGRLAREVTGISLKLVIRRNGQVDSLEQTSGGGGAIVTTTVTYTDWGKPDQVAAPPKDQIDPTPTVDEEGIAAYKDAKLYMPRAIPDGWTPTAANVLSAEETSEGCAEVELDYEDPNDPNAGTLSIFEFPISCERVMSGSGVVAFNPGGHPGTAQTGDEGTFAQIHVGNTLVQAETDLSLEDLGAVLETLVPLNLKATPAQLPGVGRKRVTA